MFHQFARKVEHFFVHWVAVIRAGCAHDVSLHVATGGERGELYVVDSANGLLEILLENAVQLQALAGGDAKSGVADFVAKIELGEQIGPRLEPNTIIEVSADPMASMVRFTEGSEYTQFSGYWTTIMSQYHQSEDEFEARASRAWPSETPDTVPVLAEQVSLTVAAAQQKAKRRADSGGPTNTTEDDAEPDVVPFKDWDHRLSRRPPQ